MHLAQESLDGKAEGEHFFKNFAYQRLKQLHFSHSSDAVTLYMLVLCQ